MTALLSASVPRDTEEVLLSHGIPSLRLPPHPALPAPLASHPDLLFFFAPEKVYCLPGYPEIAPGVIREISRLTGRPVEKIPECAGNVYPEDVRLNVLPLGTDLFGRGDAVSTVIRNLDGTSFHHIRQGYAKCAALPVGTDAVVTSDQTIAKAAKETGKQVLLISPGNIDLPGYDTGLIGGASSFAPYEPVASVWFCGNPEWHPDGDKIRAFCRERGCEVIPTGARPLLDVGTIFLI